MHLRLMIIATVSLTLGNLATGCGDDAATLTAAEFREQADAICAAGDQEIGAAVGSVFGSEEPTPAQLQAALDTIVTVSRRQLGDIDALAEPSELAADVAAFIAEGRSATDVAAGQGLEFFETDDDPWAHATELAGRLGLTTCSGG